MNYLYIIDILLGSRNKRILENGHNMLSTWGIGTELSKDDWLVLVDMMIGSNYIRKYGEYSVLQLTEDGKSLLATREKVFFPIVISGKSDDSGFGFPKKNSEKPAFIVHKKTEKIIAEKPAVDDEAAEELITKLKAWRKRKAEDMNVPPYIVFGDKTLLDLVAKKPKDKSELLSIYGIGEAKIENFGSALLRILNEP